MHFLTYPKPSHHTTATLLRCIRMYQSSLLLSTTTPTASRTKTNISAQNFWTFPRRVLHKDKTGLNYETSALIWLENEIHGFIRSAVPLAASSSPQIMNQNIWWPPTCLHQRCRTCLHKHKVVDQIFRHPCNRYTRPNTAQLISYFLSPIYDHQGQNKDSKITTSW